VSISNRDEFDDALIDFLSQYSKPVEIDFIYKWFKDKHTFRTEWYKEIPQGQYYNEMKGMGCDAPSRVPPEKIPLGIRTEPKWKMELRGSRDRLKKKGFIADSARGTWMLKPGHSGNLQRDRTIFPAEHAALRQRLHAVIDTAELPLLEELVFVAKDFIDRSEFKD